MAIAAFVPDPVAGHDDIRTIAPTICHAETMMTSLASYFSEIGSDVLGVATSVVQLIADLLGAVGTGPGGAYPPGQYPLA